MHLLAYNLIRGVMAKAAQVHDKQPRRISFKGCAPDDGRIRRRLALAPPEIREYLIQVMLKSISEHQVGDRPGRVEPSRKQT